MGLWEHGRYRPAVRLGMGLVHGGLAVVAEDVDRAGDPRRCCALRLGRTEGEPMDLRGTQVRKEEKDGETCDWNGRQTRQASRGR